MTPAERHALIGRYRDGAAILADAVRDATDAELDRLPADGGWSARMVVHHVADSETNAAIRLRRLLVEDAPHIIGYDEGRWAERLRYDRPIATSLALIAAVRAASLELLLTVDEADWARAGTHSERGAYGMTTWLETYARHCHDHAEQARRAIAGTPASDGRPR